MLDEIAEQDAQGQAVAGEFVEAEPQERAVVGPAGVKTRVQPALFQGPGDDAAAGFALEADWFAGAAELLPELLVLKAELCGVVEDVADVGLRDRVELLVVGPEGAGGAV